MKQVIQKLLGGQIDFAKIRRLTPKDKGFEENDMNAFLAATNFLIFNAARNKIDPEVFNRELQQLGIPAESSDGISRPYRSNKDALCETLTKESLPLPRVEQIHWRVDRCVASNYQPNGLQHPRVQMSLSTSHDLYHPSPRRTLHELGVEVKLATKQMKQTDTNGTSNKVTIPPELSRRLDKAYRSIENTEDVEGSERPHKEVIKMVMSKDTLVKLRSELKSALTTIEHYREVLESGSASEST